MACKKVSYRSKEFADADVERLQRTSKRRKVPLRSYFCPKCGLYHLTAQTDRADGIILAYRQRIKSLSEEISELKKENKILKDSTRREFQKEIFREESIKSWNNLMADKNKRNRELRDQIISLMRKIGELQKQIL